MATNRGEFSSEVVYRSSVQPSLGLRSSRRRKVDNVR